jgi:probable addiction module antidote protein
MTELVDTPFDAAKFIRTPADVVEFLNDAFDSGHPPYIAAVLGDVARSEGMTRLARRAGVNRQALYAALSESGNPTLETLMKVMAALGLRLRCEPVDLRDAA